jgi:hypothetical protein
VCAEGYILSTVAKLVYTVATEYHSIQYSCSTELKYVICSMLYAVPVCSMQRQNSSIVDVDGGSMIINSQQLYCTIVVTV